jgi:hypothetical protein
MLEEICARRRRSCDEEKDGGDLKMAAHFGEIYLAIGSRCFLAANIINKLAKTRMKIPETARMNSGVPFQY